MSHDVPDHGLVAGNPARLAGYVCSCGRTLVKRGESLYCGHCNRTYDFPPVRRAGTAVIKMAQPQIGEAEREAVLAVLASGRLANGPVTRELEAAFAQRRFAHAGGRRGSERHGGAAPGAAGATASAPATR